MMKIRVLHDFGGEVTELRRVLPGEYDSEDARLYGALEELLAGGHAEIIVELPPEATEPEPPPKKRGNK